MRIKAITLLFFFVSFLTLPTILSRVSNDIDISMAYTLAEEEETHNPVSEVFNDFVVGKSEITIVSLSLKQDKIIDEFLLRHNNISSEILSPPPEQKLV